MSVLVDNCQVVLSRLLADMGFEDAPLELLEITDDGVALPTHWPITANAVAVLAAVGLAAARLSQLRLGVANPVKVGTHHAGLTMANSSYLLVDGRPAKFRDPFTGFYAAANDRWVFLHGNFSHLRDGVLALLGVTSVEDVAAAVRKHDAFDLEAKGVAAGLCIAAVRTRSEWQAEAQCAALSSLPLIEMARAAGGEARQSTPRDKPLSGLRMLDISRVIAGPMCGRTFAEFGGETLLISGPGLPSIESLVIDTGFAKRSASLDLSKHEDRKRFEALIRDGDVFLDAYRPGSLARRGYGIAELTALRPGLVHVELDAFSRLGPWAHRRGYDSLVQATVGMCWDGTKAPENLPCQPLDYLTGYLCALAAILSIIRRIEHGGSWSSRLSLVRTAEWMWQTYDGLGAQESFPNERMRIEDARDGGLLHTYATDFGTVEALRSALQPSEWRWPAPPLPLGADAAVWLT
ncbi:CoA transferase [Devosia sp. 2618]|uniref:CoA transferase n=1 Tax=Devosia sp. 2618 TaxID=3156454 RepID=UPI003391A335